MSITKNTLEPALALAHGHANTRAVPLVREIDAHQGRVFFCPLSSAGRTRCSKLLTTY